MKTWNCGDCGAEMPWYEKICQHCFPGREVVYGLPVLGSVDTDGKLALTPEGTRLLIGETRYGVPLAQLASGPCGPDSHDGRTTLAVMEDMADALCESAVQLEAHGEYMCSDVATSLRLAANEIRGAAIRLYGVARELRRD